MAIEVFNRQELKFVITRKQYSEIIPKLMHFMRLDKHNANKKTYPLYNLYIDTSDYELIRHSMAKPTVYKEKIRIRSYVPLESDGIVFLEVKKRYKKITNKRRTKILLSDALKFIKTGSPPALQEYMNPQVIKEFEVILTQRPYTPRAYISYNRMALHTLETTSDLRITFDSGLISQSFGEDALKSLLDEDKLIMEIKSTSNMPLWLVNLLNEHSIYKQSFSKYGTEHMRMLQEQQYIGAQYA